MPIPHNAVEVFALIGCITTMYVGVRLLIKLIYRVTIGPLPTNRNRFDAGDSDSSDSDDANDSR